VIGGNKMNMALKEMKKNKIRFLILGSIVFLVSLLTFIISGLANGLSEDNAALIKDLPDGLFYLSKDSDQSINLSRIEPSVQDHLLNKHKEAVAFSIQMGFLNDKHDKQQSVAFVASTKSQLFVDVKKGEIVLDQSMKDKGLNVGDTLTNNQYRASFLVKGFVDQKKFSHAPVAFINLEDYNQMYRVNEMQMIFVPGDTPPESTAGLEWFSKNQFLNTISSYKAEQTSLNMIVWFLVVISGMFFGIFFYMMNVQKMGLYGILKAIGVKTSTLFNMMWIQMIVITGMALTISMTLSQTVNLVAPKEMPFSLTLESTLQISFVFILIGFIGATLSGIQIKKVQPLHAIQQGEG
jgi:putative ABC transport system permease protein